jgi:hypothetical protein
VVLVLVEVEVEVEVEVKLWSTLYFVLCQVPTAGSVVLPMRMGTN